MNTQRNGMEKSVKKMFAKPRAKVAKKKAAAKRVQTASRALAAPYKAPVKKRAQRRSRSQTVGKLGRVASVTQTKNGGLLIQFYKPKQLHFRFPTI